MVDYREILRLKSLGNNITQVAQAVHSSRNTVRDIEKLADEKGISWPLSEELTNQRLQELAKKGVNLTLLHSEYKVYCASAGRVPYQFTQFCEIYRNWAMKSKATMRIHHKPGDSMEVDWAGGTLPITDPVTGESEPAFLFVAVLPCSCYAYAELCTDMKSENWLLCSSLQKCLYMYHRRS